MSVKQFLNEWKPKNLKGMSKDDRTYLLYDNLQEITEFYIKKGHKSQDIVKELFDRMQDEKFAKTLRRILKTNDYNTVDLGFATVIADFLEKRISDLDEDVVVMYTDSVDKILKKRIKKLQKKLNLDKDLLKEMLVVVSEPEAISNPDFLGIYVGRILRKLYALVKENELQIDSVKTVKKLFKEIFGENMLNTVAINILLERKEFIKNYNENQLGMWNLMTNFALATLESNKKKEIAQYLEYYVARRTKDAAKNRDSARRVQFNGISSEEYPKLVKVANVLGEKEKNRRFL